MKEQAFICRFCLTDQGRSVNLFEHYVPSEKVFLNQLAALMFGLKILKNDGITDQICLGCFLKTYQTFFFRRKCLSSEKALFQKQGTSHNISLVQEGLECKGNERPVRKGSGYAQEILRRKVEKGSPSKPLADKDVTKVPSKEVRNIHQRTHAHTDCHCHLSHVNDTGSVGRKKFLPSNQRIADGTTDPSCVNQSQSHAMPISQENISPFENRSPLKSQISMMAAHRTLSTSVSVSESYQERNSEFLAFLEKAGQKSINKELLDLKAKHQNLLHGKGGRLQAQYFGLKEDDSHKNSEIETLYNQKAGIRIKSSSALASDRAKNNHCITENIPALIPATTVNYCEQDCIDVGGSTKPTGLGSCKNRDIGRGISTYDIASLNTASCEDIPDPDNTFDSSNSMMVVGQIASAKADQDMDIDSGYHSEFIRFLNSNISDQDCVEEMVNEAYKASLQEVLILNKKCNEKDISYNYQNIQHQDEVIDVNDNSYPLDNPVEGTRCIRIPRKSNLEITSKDNYREQINLKEVTSCEESLNKSINPSFCRNGLDTECDSDAETVSAFPLQSLRKKKSPVGEVSVNESSIYQVNKVGNNRTLISSKRNLSLLQKGCSSFIGINMKTEKREMEDVTQREVNKIIQEKNSENIMESERSSSVDMSKICGKEKQMCAEIGSKIISDTGKSSSSIDLNGKEEKKEIKFLQIKVKEESRLCHPKNNEDSLRKRKRHESPETKSAKIRTSDSVKENKKEALGKNSEQSLLCLSCKKCFTSSDLLLQHVLQHIEEESFDDFHFGDTSKVSELHSIGKTPSVEEEIEILWDSVKTKHMLQSSSEVYKADNNETVRNKSSIVSNGTGSQDSDAETSLGIVDEECSVVFIGKCPEGKEICNKTLECLPKKSPGRSGSNSVNEDDKQPLTGNIKSRSVSPVQNSDDCTTECGKGNTLANKDNDPSVHRNNICTLSHKNVSNLLYRESKFSRWFSEQNECIDKLKIPFLENETVSSLEIDADKVERVLNDVSCDKMKSSYAGCNSMQCHVYGANGDSSKIESSVQKITSQISKNMVKSEPVTLKEISNSFEKVMEEHAPSKSDETLSAVDGSKSTKFSLQVKSEPVCSNKHVTLHFQEESKSNPALYPTTKADTHSKQDNNKSLEPLLKEKSSTKDPKGKTFSLNAKAINSPYFHSRACGQSEKDKKDNGVADKSDSFKLYKISNLNKGVPSKMASSDYKRGNAGSSASNISINESSVEICQNESTFLIQNEKVGVSKERVPSSQEQKSIMMVNHCSNENSAKKDAVTLHNIEVVVTRKKKKRKKRAPLEVQKDGSSFSFPCNLCSKTFSTHGSLLQHMSIHKSTANNQQKDRYGKEPNSSLFKSRQQMVKSNHYLTECQSKRNPVEGNFEIRPRTSGMTFEREKLVSHAGNGERRSVMQHNNTKRMKKDRHSNEIFKRNFAKFGDGCRVKGNNIEIRHNFQKQDIITPSNVSHSNKFILGQNAMHCANPPKDIQVPSKFLCAKGGNDSSISYNTEASTLNFDQRNLCSADNSDVVESSVKDNNSKEEHLSLNCQIPISNGNLGTNQSHSSDNLTCSSGWTQDRTEKVFECWICGKSFYSAQVLRDHACSHFQSEQRPSSESYRTSQEVTREVTSQPNIHFISEITKANFTLENKSSHFLIGHSSRKLEISPNRQVTPGLNETYQRGEVIESKINEGRRMIQNKLAVNDYGPSTSENKSFRCPACFMIYAHWSLITSHIVTCHNELSSEWPVCLLFIPEMYQKMNEIPENNLGSTQAEVDSSCQESFSCEFCDKLFVSTAALLKHKIWFHNVSADVGT